MIKIAVIGVAAVLTALMFKKGKEEYALYIVIAACILIVLSAIGRFDVILDAVNKLQSYVNINKAYVEVLVKIIGITYVTEISASLCRDSGYQSIGEQIEMAGKLTILAISMPILLALLETINNFLRA